MAGRNPRRPSAPALTKTQQLRQAKSAAFVKEYEQKQEMSKPARAGPPGPSVPGRRVAPKREPKKVDFGRPGMTKAMIARMKQAERFKEEYERKREEQIGPAGRRPRRTPAPVGGDARMGRERRAGAPPVPLAIAAQAQRISPRRSPRVPSPIPERTRELARSMDAEIVQAEPVGEGPIDNIIIPAGTVNENRNVIVNIPQPSPAAAADAHGRAHGANRSIQVISEALDDQDAAEAAAVQCRLVELQQARREFVIAVANVGGNSLNIADETPPTYATPPPLTPSPRRLLRVPEVSDEMFQVEYGRDHPDVVAAREFARRSQAMMLDREAQRRLDEEFERIARQPAIGEELQLDVPFEEEFYQEADVSWEEDEEGMPMPRPSRARAAMSPIPVREQSYQYSPFDPEELERFFDLEMFPPCPRHGAPPGREQLHPDLWEFDDPWYRTPPQPDVPDLIDFGD